MTQIVAITGKRGHGKDTAARGLVSDHGLYFEQMSFADPLREIIEIVYGITMHEMLDPILKEQPLTRYPFKSPREILTLIGTEGFRNLIADDTWVQAFLRRAQKHNRVVISDLRFLNEEKALRSANAIIVRVVNPNRNDTDAVSQHRSETEMDQITPDFTVINDGTIEDLKIKMANLIIGEIGKA